MPDKHACVQTAFMFMNPFQDVFIEKLVAKVNELKVGNGLEEGVDIGPLIDQSAVDKGTKAN